MESQPQRSGKNAADKKTKSAAVSLTSKAYDAIKSRIVTTVYAPGAHLNETAISIELGIGRTPVREALHRLAQNGLVDIIPRKGVIVRPFSLDEIAHVIE